MVLTPYGRSIYSALVGALIPFQTFSVYKNLSLADALVLSGILLAALQPKGLASPFNRSVLSFVLISTSLGALLIAVNLIRFDCFGPDDLLESYLGYCQVVLCLIGLPIFVRNYDGKYLSQSLIVTLMVLGLILISDAQKIVEFGAIVSYKAFRPSLDVLGQEQNATAFLFATGIVLCLHLMRHSSKWLMAVNVLGLVIFVLAGLMTISRTFVVFLILLVLYGGFLYRGSKRLLLLATVILVLSLWALARTSDTDTLFLEHIVDRVGTLSDAEGSYSERSAMYDSFFDHLMLDFLFVGAGFSNNEAFGALGSGGSIHNAPMDLATRGGILTVLGGLLLCWDIWRISRSRRPSCRYLLLPYVSFLMFVPFLYPRALFVAYGVLLGGARMYRPADKWP